MKLPTESPYVAATAAAAAASTTGFEVTSIKILEHCLGDVLAYMNARWLVSRSCKEGESSSSSNGVKWESKYTLPLTLDKKEKYVAAPVTLPTPAGFVRVVRQWKPPLPSTSTMTIWCSL